MMAMKLEGGRMEPKEGWCECEKRSSVYTEHGDFGCWDRCSDCGKVIEGSFMYYNHYDGEDHLESDSWER